MHPETQFQLHTQITDSEMFIEAARSPSRAAWFTSACHEGIGVSLWNSPSCPPRNQSLRGETGEQNQNSLQDQSMKGKGSNCGENRVDAHGHCQSLVHDGILA